MKILTVGDIVGDIGIKKFQMEFQNLKDEVDFCIVNAENSAEGFGILEKQYNLLVSLGVDVITMGDHTWGKKDIFNFIDNNNIIRPANLSSKAPGKGYTVIDKNNKRICVISLLGRTFLNVLSNNPFETIDEILKNIDADIFIIDFHAEATAEKIAMGRFVDGRVNVLFGTHTHVQTADEMILDKGTAYITDIGMTGPKNSVIGMDVEVSLKRFQTSLPERYKTAEGEAKLNACLFEIDDATNKIVKITRINR